MKLSPVFEAADAVTRHPALKSQGMNGTGTRSMEREEDA